MTKKTLPIDSFLPEVIQSLKEKNTVILQATPGAGKTTRVPPALQELTDKMILVLEPRRLAARASAQRVAEERGEACGESVGYQVRFEKKEGANTKIKFITEGLFLRLLLSNPNLMEIDCVVLDEFHERHTHSDVALMLVRHLQQTTRPDLKLIVMSATLETQGLAQYMPEAKVFVCQSENYPVKIEYLSKDLIQKSLESKVYFAVEKHLKEQTTEGHILVFLPGRSDIQKTAQLLQDLKGQFSFDIHQLSADTPFEEQQKIFQPTSKRKIILSTNVAETSVTIEGVTCVIDSGLAKISGHAAWSGLPTLELKSISKASCIQRTGRAGRTQAGYCIRLFSEYDFHLRSSFETPEIQRVDLTQTLLELQNLFQIKIQSYPWFETPLESAVEGASQLLYFLGALDKNSMLTTTGKELSQWPFHPRLSRILLEGQQLNCFAQSLLLVSLLNEGSIFKKNISRLQPTHSDVDFQLNILREILVQNTDKNEILSHATKSDLDHTQIKKIETLCRQLCFQWKIPFSNCLELLSEENLSKLLLSGYLDRVCKLRTEAKNSSTKRAEYNLCLGGGALLSPASTVEDEEFIIAIFADEASAKNQAHSTQIQFAHGFSKQLLLTGHEDFLEKKEEAFWNEERKAAFCMCRTYYGKIILKEENLSGKENLLENILLEQVKKQWPIPFEDDKPLAFYNQRLLLAHENNLSLSAEPLQGEDLELFHVSLCEGKKSFAQILERNLQDYLEEFIGYSATKELNDLFPTHITVGKGRKIQVHYEEGKPPFVSSRLQDFFGTLQTPQIANNRISLVVHLLAPNGQSVQVTTDLAGFWERGYQEVKRELSRRYPRHSWPDDPKNTEPPELFRKKKSF